MRCGDIVVLVAGPCISDRARQTCTHQRCLLEQGTYRHTETIETAKGTRSSTEWTWLGVRCGYMKPTKYTCNDKERETATTMAFADVRNSIKQLCECPLLAEAAERQQHEKKPRHHGETCRRLEENQHNKRIEIKDIA